ncbi:MAG: glycosyltransferase family 9 protein, partial [Gemmatimonadetes bacterium]|nr:glycosyltransferase family 9 protein [Gemmatimonadota bacterium]
MCETMTVSGTLSRILVIRFSSMGDIVLTSPVTRQLGRLWPDADVEFLTRAEYAPLVRALPGVAAVQCFEPGTGLMSLVSRLRKRRYDLAIDLHGNLRSRLVVMAGIAGRVLRYDKRRFARMAIVRRRRRSRPVPHTVDRYLEVLDQFNAAAAPGPEVLDQFDAAAAPGLEGGPGLEGTSGLEGAPGLESAHDTAEMRLPQLKVDGAAAALVEERLAGAGIGPDVRVLGVAPGASHGPKRWPPDRFAR